MHNIKPKQFSRRHFFAFAILLLALGASVAFPFNPRDEKRRGEPREGSSRNLLYRHRATPGTLAGRDLKWRVFGLDQAGKSLSESPKRRLRFE